MMTDLLKSDDTQQLSSTPSRRDPNHKREQSSLTLQLHSVLPTETLEGIAIRYDVSVC